VLGREGCVVVGEGGWGSDPIRMGSVMFLMNKYRFRVALCCFSVDRLDR
jgi:hypothetical protein